MEGNKEVGEKKLTEKPRRTATRNARVGGGGGKKKA